MLPVARTRDEAHLYMDLHACPACGGVDVAWAAALVDEDGTMARRYSGACAGCGAERDFVFALPEKPTLPRPGQTVTFGAVGESSYLFDAGQWYAIAEMMALAADLDAPAAQRAQSLAIAIACVEEVLKFVPEGADEPGPSAWWTAAGQGERDRAPDKFRRPALEQRRAELSGKL